MLVIAAVSLWCWAGSLLWRVKRRVSMAIARVQSEFVESSISEASHGGSEAAVRGWACGILEYGGWVSYRESILDRCHEAAVVRMIFSIR
jgi:hypothetical protein